MREYCKNGHALTPENVYVFRGSIRCRECRRINRNASYHRYSNHAPRGPKPKKVCVHGHELTAENTYQTFKNGKKNGRKCRQCNRDLALGYRGRKPDIAATTRLRAQMKRLYGITGDPFEARDALLASQGNACPICDRTGLTWDKGFNNVWHIDHPHDKPGTHRGILCARCNTALGRLEPFFDKVVAYLKKYS
jgi:hypothetical protein